MDLESRNPEKSRNLISGTKARSKSRTKLRLKYEAQAQVIEKQIGTLTEIQSKMGVSGRQICQLLLVDPSAWSRWTKQGQKPPPHIMRALQWHFMIQEKRPEFDMNFWTSSLRRSPKIENVNLDSLKSTKNNNEVYLKMSELEKQIQTQKKYLAILGVLLGLYSAFLLFWLLTTNK